MFKPLSDSGRAKYDLRASIQAYIVYVTKGLKPGEESAATSLRQQKLFEEVRKPKLENNLRESTSIPKDDAELVVQKGFGIILARGQAVPRRLQAKLTSKMMREIRDELDEARAAGSDRHARLGAVDDGGDDDPPPEDPAPRPVGKRKSDNPDRKRRAGLVQK